MASSPPVSDLAAHLGFWLRMVSNHVSHAFADKLAAKEVTVAEWCLMRTLFAQEPTPPSCVADAMGMSRGAITKLADRLIAKSFIAREASTQDGRAQTLALTARGVAVVPELAALADRNDAEFFACLTAAERATLQRLLKRIAERNHLASTPTD